MVKGHLPFLYLSSLGLGFMVGASRISIDTHTAWQTLVQMICNFSTTWTTGAGKSQVYLYSRSSSCLKWARRGVDGALSAPYPDA